MLYVVFHVHTDQDWLVYWLIVIDNEIKETMCVHTCKQTVTKYHYYLNTTKLSCITFKLNGCQFKTNFIL